MNAFVKKLVKVKNIILVQFQMCFFSDIRTVEKGGAGMDASPSIDLPSKNIFSLVKSENIKFLQVNNIWDFSLFC